MRIRDFLEQHISAALCAAGAPAGSRALVQPAGKPEFGDYQANGVMAAAKALKTNPRQLAQTVLERLTLNPVAERIEIAGPGFINIHLRADWLADGVKQALTDPRLGVEPARDCHTVVVDYSHPNLAKEMHVGHLRSTIIGDAIVRVLMFLGHKVIRHNHVGDWGTQFGMLIAHMDDLASHADSDVSTQLADLETFYRAAKKRFDSDAAFADRARDYVVKLQSGDAHCRRVWQTFITESLRHCEQVYAALGVTLTREDVRPESAYNDDLPKVIDDLHQLGLLTESDGAQCVFLEEFTGKDGKPLPTIVQKSDGGYLYATTDLAAARYRANVIKADRILYIVDARQNLHLKQVFAVARAAKFVPDTTRLEHFAFGTMLGNDGKPFKTREGGTVKLMALLDEARQRAFDLVTEKNPELGETQRRHIAEVIGIGAVKYADLSQHRTGDYVFSWDKMLALDGNTAPYMQYAYVRIRSIFRRAGIDETQLHGPIVIGEPSERALAVHFLRCNDVIDAVANDGVPHLLCAYLYELAGLFMSFYESCPVLKAAEPLRSSRLQLCLHTANTIKLGLQLLGIRVVDEM